MASNSEKRKPERVRKPADSVPQGSGKPAPEKPGPTGDRDQRPALTERQRIEARRRREARQAQRRRAQPGNALSRGMRATGHEIARTSRYLARAVAAAFEAAGPLGRRLGILLGRAGALLVAVAAGLISALAALAAAVGRGFALLDRNITLRRALLTVSVLAVALLAYSQFTDYRATAIGQPGYSGIEDVIAAPRVDVRSPLNSHSVILLVAAVLAAAGLAGSIRTGRRIYATLLLAAGVLTLAVTGLFDTRSGLDLGEAELSYAGASALLLSGFWLQLASGLVLFWAGLFLPLNSPGRPRADRPTVARERIST